MKNTELLKVNQMILAFERKLEKLKLQKKQLETEM